MIEFDVIERANKQVIQYLRSRDRTAPDLALPTEVADPYMAQGSHPDVVGRVWNELGSTLAPECRLVVCGTPVLVHPRTGSMLAFCAGTQYCLRLPTSLVAEAISMGAKRQIRWSDGKVFDTQHQLGPDWVVGCWLEQEISWCNATYQDMEVTQ